MREWPVGSDCHFEDGAVRPRVFGMGATESTATEVLTTSCLLNWYVDQLAPGLVLAVLKTWDLWLADTINDRRKRAYKQSVYLAEASGGGHDSLPEVRQWLVDNRGGWPTGVAHFGERDSFDLVPRLARVRLSEAKMEGA